MIIDMHNLGMLHNLHLQLHYSTLQYIDKSISKLHHY